jgi:hypothetical protein
MAYRLTKSAYLNYLKCPPEFWLDHHNPLLTVEDKHPLEGEHLRQQGYAVEQLVKEMPRFWSNEEQLVEFQRTFNTQDYQARSDIVVTNRKTGTIEIYEIKAASKVKDEHLDDVAFQVHVAELTGARVTAAYVITMNGDYVRQGEIDREQLFVTTPVTEEVELRRSFTEEKAREAIAYLDTTPMASLLDYCKENKLSCRFIQASFPGLPDYTIFDISYLKDDKRLSLLEQGVIDIKDVPDDFPLSSKQKMQVDAAKSGAVVIDRASIRERLDSWEYPLHFLDYETFSYAIPQFDGIRPFQQMVFQYSLHTIRRPGAEPEHYEHLVRHDEPNPPLAVARSMREAFGDQIGTVFVWYEAFEKTRNSEMAAMFEEHREFFEEINSKTADLMKVFADRLYIHPEFKGRSSIKKVMPVICPDLDYSTLGIPEGLSATIKWYRAVKWTSLTEAERETIFQDLLEYCKLDTWAMVRIHEELCKLFDCEPEQTS